MHHVNKRDVSTLPPGSSVFPIYSEFFVRNLFPVVLTSAVPEILPWAFFGTRTWSAGIVYSSGLGSQYSSVCHVETFGNLVGEF